MNPAPPPRADAALRRTMALFALAACLGAFLLFSVQFMTAKKLLPWFGGAPAVWSTCMLFFQVGLLAGYLWAHGLVRRAGGRSQRNLHGVLLLGAVVLLAARAAAGASPILPGDAARPGEGDHPVAALIAILGGQVGLPYIALAATGPLTGAWFARAAPGASPYRLYALSNVGSLLGLLSYPFVIERAFSLEQQAQLWSAGFGLFAVLMIACAHRAARSATGAGEMATAAAAATAATAATAAAVPGGPADASEPATRASPRIDLLLWLALAATGSTALVAVTNQICQEVAVIPFLWVAPLTVYLLTFIVCFESDRVYRPVPWLVALVVAVGLGATQLLARPAPSLRAEVGLWTLVLLVICMCCHGELARLRPPPGRLTGFYLAIAAGGALGSLFTGLLAPAVLPDFWELHCVLLAAPALRLLSGLRAGERWLGPDRTMARTLATVCLLALGGTLATGASEGIASSLHTERNFFGVLRVVRENAGGKDEYLKLRHGRITHGLQLQDPARRGLATTYYAADSGVGRAVLRHARRLVGQPLRVGVVGLGTGTTAALARPGDTFRFYEINPAVLALSRGPSPYFTYLAGTAGAIEVGLGDARLALERERPQAFDVLAIDAFSSDSVPAHLLTREALALYLRHLRAADGLLALHVSNKVLDLQPVVARLAADAGLAGLEITVDEDDYEDDFTWSSDWILLARRPEALANMRGPGATPVKVPPGAPLWTDSYSNLVAVLK